MLEVDQLQGPRILVVEDNSMLAEVLCEYLTHNGFSPIGPAASIEAASHLGRWAELDGAILDIKLANRFSFPVCTILTERSIPYFFMTGFDELSVIPSALREIPVLRKPFREDEMHAALTKMLENRITC